MSNFLTIKRAIVIIHCNNLIGAAMISIDKKYVVDEHGNPKEVLIQFEDFKKIEELLGLDLDDSAISDLQEARRNREAGKTDAYVNLDSIE